MMEFSCKHKVRTDKKWHQGIATTSSLGALIPWFWSVLEKSSMTLLYHAKEDNKKEKQSKEGTCGRVGTI